MIGVPSKIHFLHVAFSKSSVQFESSVPQYDIYHFAASMRRVTGMARCSSLRIGLFVSR